MKKEKMYLYMVNILLIIATFYISYAYFYTSYFVERF